MPQEKPPYKLVIKLDSAKPEHVASALTELRERAAEYDQTGETSATMTIEAWQESALRAVMDAFETWLYYKGHVDCEMKLQRPGIRPETSAMLSREKKKTPMDGEGWEDEPVGSDTAGAKVFGWLAAREQK
jgi:hypothetical protein